MKIAFLITARLKSTRLPMKVIKPMHGKPMIVHMLDRLKESIDSSSINLELIDWFEILEASVGKRVP